MTEEEARAWLTARWSDAKVEALARFADLVLSETTRQNLISPASCAHIWTRHIVDSAQLLEHQPARWTSWLDIGSGAGFPGVVVAILTERSVTLVEPRARRVEFLRDCADRLSLGNIAVTHAKAEALTGTFDIVSARAVATLPALFAMSRHLRHRETRMILPRGRNGATEVAQLPRDWRGMFHVEQSVTDPESVIIVADGVTT